MFRYTLRSLLAHKARLLFTAAAIVVGVGLLAGTFILTDTAKAGGRDAGHDAADAGHHSASHHSAGHHRAGHHRADVTVRRLVTGGNEEIFSDQTGEFFPGSPIPAPVVGQVARIDGVATATGVIVGAAQLIGRDGHVHGGRAPLGRSIDSSFAADLRAGRLPTGPGEIVIDQATAHDQGLRAGDRVRIITSGGAPRPVTVVGVLRSPEISDKVALVGFDPATARRLLAPAGTVGYIEVHAAPGVDEQRLRDRVTTVLNRPAGRRPPSSDTARGSHYQAFTGATLATERTKPDSLIGQILFVAGLVALFAGSFLIRNTFSMVLAARTRELALLRCVGAGRGQVRRAILLESSVVGVVGAALGLVAGVGIAWVLGGLLHSGGAIVADVTGTMPRITARTVTIAMAAGVLTAAVAAWGPARRATRVPPVAALRGDVFTLDRRESRFRTLVGALATLAGIATVLLGVLSDPVDVSFMRGGTVAIAVGVLVLAPVLARACSALFGLPIRRALGVVGDLARGNAVRSPRRTAATLLPMVIGLALIGFLTTLAAGTKASSVGGFDRTIRADFRLEAIGGGFHQPRMSPEAADRVAALPGLDAVVAFRDTEATVAGAAGFVTAATNPGEVGRIVSPSITAGSLSGLGPGGIVVSRSAADAHHLSVGSPVTVGTARSQRVLAVRAIYDDHDRDLGDFVHLPFGDYLIAAADYERLADDAGVTQLYATTRHGAQPGATEATQTTKAAIGRTLADYPNVEIADRGELRHEVSAAIDPALRVYYSLFGLVLVIALFGIFNTLALSILERTRELGLLRVVGMDRRQVRSMVRWEAVIIAGIGAVIGLGLGTFLGWATTITLHMAVATVPVAPLAGFAVVAVVAGAAAAWPPARRAARTPMLRAVAAE